MATGQGKDFYKLARKMLEVPGYLQKDINGNMPEKMASFTVLTYNILAQDHIHRTAYPYCAKESLRWSHRRERLVEELKAYDSDIVCFQEMDRFHDCFLPFLIDSGYMVKYYMRNGPRSDVNAVGWKEKIFEYLDSLQISFSQTTENRGSVPNVAQIVALRLRSNKKMGLIVATTHLYWREECDHIRLIQMHRLLEESYAFKETMSKLHPETQFACLFAGDFNSDRESMAIQLALRMNATTLLLQPEPFKELRERLQTSEAELRKIICDFTTWPRLYDAYASYSNVVSEKCFYDLPYTTFCLYKGILDFILFGQFDAYFQIYPEAILDVPERGILEEEVALPNRKYSSDHIALLAKFGISSL